MCECIHVCVYVWRAREEGFGNRTGTSQCRVPTQNPKVKRFIYRRLKYRRKQNFPRFYYEFES